MIFQFNHKQMEKNTHEMNYDYISTQTEYMIAPPVDRV